MKISWKQGLSKDQAAEVDRDFQASLLIRRRLKEILLKRIETSNSSSRSKVNYDSPNWAYLQADARGYERALSEVIDLVFEETVENASKK